MRLHVFGPESENKIERTEHQVTLHQGPESQLCVRI